MLTDSQSTRYVDRLASENKRLVLKIVLHETKTLLQSWYGLPFPNSHQFHDLIVSQIAAKTLYGGILPGAPQGNHRYALPPALPHVSLTPPA